MTSSNACLQAKLLYEMLAARGFRRVVLLGTGDDLAGGLKTQVARRGLQVLTPPTEGCTLLERLMAKPNGADEAEPRKEDRESFKALMSDGLEHGVDAVAVLRQELMPIIGAYTDRVPVVPVWQLAEVHVPKRVRNIVFDMGGVLLRWEPLKMARAACESDEDAKLLAKAVFGSQEWAWQDAGAVSEDTVAFAARLALPKRLHDAAERLVYHWHDARGFIPQTGDLIRELKDAGYGIYLLSNAGESFAAYKDQLPAIECFDGMVVSCYEHVVKPDARIYRILCDRYGLDPATCLFVDDTPKNVEAARCLGMDAWRFDGDVEALRGYLLG